MESDLCLVCVFCTHLWQIQWVSLSHVFVVVVVVVVVVIVLYCFILFLMWALCQALLLEREHGENSFQNEQLSLAVFKLQLFNNFC